MHTQFEKTHYPPNVNTLTEKTHTYNAEYWFNDVHIDMQKSCRMAGLWANYLSWSMNNGNGVCVCVWSQMGVVESHLYQQAIRVMNVQID